MHKGIVLVCLWALGESSYIPDNGQFVHPHNHVPQNEDVSLDAEDVGILSGLKIVSGANDVHLQEIASKIGNIHYLHTILKNMLHETLRYTNISAVFLSTRKP